MRLETGPRTESPEKMVNSLITNYLFWLMKDPGKPKDPFDIQGGIEGHADNVQDLVGPMFTRLVTLQGFEEGGQLKARLEEIESPEGKLRWMLNHLVSETAMNMP